MLAAALAASQWRGHEGARTRLIAGPATSDGWIIGWQVDLQPGWKTYWRSPGEAGLPPRLRFDGSSNLADAEIAFPLPDRFDFFGIESFGYADQLVLPVTVTAEDPSRPVDLQVAADFMVCSDICIPHQGAYEMTLTPGQRAPKAQAALVAAALERVPAKAAQGPVRVEEITVRGPAGRQTLSVIIAADQQLEQPDLFIEVDAAFGLGAPAFALLQDGTRGRFVVAVDGGPERRSLSGETVPVTVSAGKHAVERTLTLD